MKAIRPVALSIVLCLVSAAALWGQVAKPHLISKGNLTVTTGNPSPIRVGDTRLYGLFGIGESRQEAKDDTGIDGTISEIAFGADFGWKKGTYSVGYSLERIERSFTGLGFDLSLDDEIAVLVGQLVFAVKEDAFIAGTVQAVSAERKASSGGLSISDDHSYFDVAIGGSASLAGSFRAGIFFSPPVSSKESFSRAGHGLLVQGGAGYVPLESVALGLDLLVGLENEDAYAQAITALIASVEWAVVPTIVLGGGFTTFEQEELTVGGSAISPPSKGTVFIVEGFWNADPANDLIVGFSVLQQSESASDFGNPADNFDRTDTFDATLYRFSLSGSF